MSKPRDFDASRRTGLVRTARLFSNIVSPPVMFAVLGLVFALHALPFWEGLAWAAVYGFWISLAPILFILYLLKTGRIKELHMSDTSERHWPYVSAVATSLIMLGLIRAFDGPELLRCLSLFNLIELASLGIINYFWLISIHATGITATAILVGLVFGTAWGLALLPLLGLVLAARLFLKRHTPAQLVAGIALGVVTVLSLIQMGCF